MMIWRNEGTRGCSEVQNVQGVLKNQEDKEAVGAVRI